MAKIAVFLKSTLDKYPVPFVSCVITAAALVLPFISPIMDRSRMINAAMPYKYPVPVRDDGNMPDVPAHPCEPKGPSLEWLKNM